LSEYKSKSQKKKFYRSSNWETIRQQALKRDNYECQLCKAEGKVHIDSIKVEGERKAIKLNVHHIKEIETHPELSLDIDNLQTICLYHHNVAHGRGFKRKINKWAEDEQW
jgi:5-methylcytosine-specific restriction endonuclease McrA